MKISALSTNHIQSKNFKGHWENTTFYNAASYPLYDQKIYVPESNETPQEIALAWEKETRMLPIDWVQHNNIYANQYDKSTAPKYKIKNNPYMPLDVLKASALIKCERQGGYAEDKIDALIELAKLEKQAGNEKKVKGHEIEILKTIPNILGAKYQRLEQFKLNAYKEHFGDNSVCAYIYNHDGYQDLINQAIEEYNNL